MPTIQNAAIVYVNASNCTHHTRACGTDARVCTSLTCSKEILLEGKNEDRYFNEQINTLIKQSQSYWQYVSQNNIYLSYQKS